MANIHGYFQTYVYNRAMICVEIFTVSGLHIGFGISKIDV